MTQLLGFSEELADFLPFSSRRNGDSAPHLLDESVYGKASISTSAMHGVGSSFSETFCRRWAKQPVKVSSSFNIRVWQPEEVMHNGEEQLERIYGEEFLVPSFIDIDLWNSCIKPMDHDWNDKTETDLLLSLFRSTGGRWPVISDRWQSDAVYGTRGRTLEHLKARFYRIASKLIELDNSHSTLQSHPLLSNRYNEHYDAQRRLFNEQNFSKDASTLDQQAKLVRDLFRTKLKAKPKPDNFKPGVFIGSTLAKSPEIAAPDFEKIREAAAALGVDLSGEARTLRVQKILSGITKQLHSLILMKEAISLKTRQLESLRATPVPAPSAPPPLKIKFAPSQGSKVKRKKNEE